MTNAYAPILFDLGDGKKVEFFPGRIRVNHIVVARDDPHNKIIHLDLRSKWPGSVEGVFTYEPDSRHEQWELRVLPGAESEGLDAGTVLDTMLLIGLGGEWEWTYQFGKYSATIIFYQWANDSAKVIDVPDPLA